MLCTCITRHILQSHNGLEHIFVPCWRGGNWGFHCLKTLKFQNFLGRCPEPRWGAHSAPHTPSWFCLVPPGHLNPGSATADVVLAANSSGKLTEVFSSLFRVLNTTHGVWCTSLSRPGATQFFNGACVNWSKPCTKIATNPANTDLLARENASHTIL